MKYLVFIFVIVSLSFVSAVSADERSSEHVHTGSGGAVVEGDGGAVVEGDGGAVVEGSGGNSAKLTNPLDSSISTIPAFFTAIINILLIFAIPFIVFFIIYAGFLYVTARGNAETIKKAHAALLYALIGGMLILGANVLMTVIQGTVDEIVKEK